ncbi:MAG: DUF2089 domain-containing protein [Armatimonadetes bacterium]|nr:DUF2089 domain-containing protein [Armatimonadota bacterium]
MAKRLVVCPVCSGDLSVSKVSCAACGISIEGAFGACRFCKAQPEHAAFIEMFLRHRGNMTSLAGELGVSFPTVARRLDAALDAVGLRGDPQPAPAEAAQVQPAHESARTMSDAARRAVLEMLDRGEISAEEATRRLQEY